MEVHGSVALVTGAAAETGRAIALRLADEGAAVVVADIDEHAGRETVRAIEANGGSASFVRADMTGEADVARMLESGAARRRSSSTTPAAAGTSSPTSPTPPPCSGAAP